MGRNTTINWAHATLNFVWGCTKLTEECRNCYMYRLSYRYGMDPTGLTFFHLDRKVRELRSWRDRDIIFVNSMSDTFHEAIPFETIKTWHEVFNQFPEKQFGRGSGAWFPTAWFCWKLLPNTDCIWQTSHIIKDA